MKHVFLFAPVLFVMPVFAQARANVGEKVPEATFPAFVNGDGRQKLSDFFGQPVMIDRWGTNCGPCIGAAVPSAIKHDHELKAQGLVTILVESQGADAAAHEAFLWKMFPDNDCFACTGTHVPIPESAGIPHCGLIGVDGTLLHAGNPLENPQRIEELIAAELQKVKKGWGETAEIRKVRATLYGKEDLGAAAALVAAMPEGETRSMLQAEVDKRYSIAKTAVQALKDQGNFLAAQARAKELVRAVVGKADWVAEVTPMAAEFDAAEAKAELAFDKKLDKIVKQLREKKGEAAPKALQSLLKDGANSKVGARAQRLLTALQTKAAG